MARGFALITLALLLASLSVASAQEPPSLRAAPDVGAVAQESRDVAGRWLGATDAAVQSFAKIGGTLTNIVTGKFDGLSKAIAVADAASTLGAASAGDVRGAVSGAAAIAVGGEVIAGGAALFGEVGTIAGGAIGSFFPVIGNIAGSIVGGAVGTAAGGFICAFGYDKYIKDYVAKGVTGIVSVFDTAPLSEAMQAKRAFLWATMSPEQQAQLHTFKPEEVQLLDFATLPYVVVPKQPLPEAQQAPLPSKLFGITSFELRLTTTVDHPIACTIAAGQVSCVATHVLPPGQVSYSLNGGINGNVLDVEIFHVFVSSDGCLNRLEYRGHDKITLEQGGRAVTRGTTTTTQTLKGNCPQGTPPITHSYDVVGTWRAIK